MVMCKQALELVKLENLNNICLSNEIGSIIKYSGKPPIMRIIEKNNNFIPIIHGGLPEHLEDCQDVLDSTLNRRLKEKYIITMPQIICGDFKGNKKMGLFNFFVVKKELEIEVKRLTSIIDIERKTLQAEFDILATRKSLELTEHEKRYRMEFEDKLNKQATLYNESLQKLSLKHAQEISALESRLVKEYYEKMTLALREVNLEGNFQAKSLQELSMTMFSKALEKPMPAHLIQESIITRKE